MSPFQKLLPSSSYMRSAVDLAQPGCKVWRDDDFDQVCERGLPVPPPHIMQYQQKPEVHLRTGRRDADFLSGIMDTYECSGNVLELGCGNGRILRWMLPRTETAEVWGVDINATFAIWVALHLHPIQACTMCTYGSLPFRDGFFDFAYAFSVFTHMDEAFTFWLQEMRRLLKPGGIFVVTLHDEETVARVGDKPNVLPETKRPHFQFDESAIYVEVSKHRTANSYIRRDVFTRLVSHSFDVVEIVPATMGKIQTAFVLKAR